MTEKGENFRRGVRRASLKGWHLREAKRQPREDLGRTSRHKEIARVTIQKRVQSGMEPVCPKRRKKKEDSRERALKTSVKCWIPF